MTKFNDPGFWADTVDGLFEDKSIRVVFEYSDKNRIYVDISNVDDRAKYMGFYLTKDQLQEIVKAVGANE